MPSNLRPRLEAVTFRKVERTLIATIKNVTALDSFKWHERSHACDRLGTSGQHALKQIPTLSHLNVKDMYNGTTSRYKPIHDSKVRII